MTIPSFIVNSIVFSFSLIGIIYFIVMAIINKIIGKLTDKELEELIASDEIGTDNFEYQHEIQAQFGKLDPLASYRNAFNQIDSCLMSIFIDIILRAVIFTVVIWLIFTSWFVYHDTYLQSFLATFFGILTVVTVSFIAMKFSINSIARSILECKRGRYYGFASTWISASAIGTASISFCLFFYMCFSPLNNYMYFGDGENPPMENLDFAQAYDYIDDKQKFQHLYLSEIGFALAIISCSVFMRDIPQILGSGIIIGYEMQGNTRGITESGHVEETLKKSQVISQILSQNVAASLDTISLISSFLVGINLLTSYTTLRANYMDGVFQFPLLLFAIMLIVCLGVSSIALGQKKDDPIDQYTNPDIDSIPTYTTNQMRLQLIIVNSVCFVVFLFFPLICLPDQLFDILRDQPLYPFYFTDASPYSVILCLQLGLIGQTFMLIVSEHFTSHGFRWTQNSGKKTLKDSSNGLLQITRNATLIQLIMISTLALLIFISYSQAGFYGVTLLGIAFIITPSFFLSISIFSFLLEQGQVMGNYQKESSFRIMDRLNKMQWSVINYQIFLPLLNISGMFIINLVMIGLFCVIGEVTNVIIWDTLVVYGFLIGSAVSYFIKSQSVYAIKSVANDTVQDIDNNERKHSNPDLKDVFAKQDPQDLILQKQKDCQVRMITNILICTVTILMISWLFGQKGLVGYMSGLNLVAIHMIYLNIIKFHTAKNIKIHNEVHLSLNEIDQHPDAYHNTRQLYLSLYATEGDSLMIYTLFNVLFILQGARILSLGGFLGNYLEKKNSEISNRLFNNTIGMLIRQSLALEYENQQFIQQIDQQISDGENQAASGQHQESQAGATELNRRLRELKIQEDRMALRDIQNNGNAREATIAAIERNIERSQADQAEVRSQMVEIMQQIRAINNNQSVPVTGIEQIAMVFMSL